MMIVRTWHGIVPIHKSEDFRKYLMMTGVAEAKALSGNLGVYIHNQSLGGYEHFFMVSYWDNLDSIKKFAGMNPQIAVTYPEDSKYDLISDPIVLHHEVPEVPTEFPLFRGRNI